jgi:hypothetical protein
VRKLTGKIALITGGNSGIGLASAKAFVGEGAHVLITGRRATELDKAVKEIGRNVTDVLITGATGSTGQRDAGADQGGVCRSRSRPPRRRAVGNSSFRSSHVALQGSRYVPLDT